ncbi:MAG: YihY/virulence factor BrkB family protein [Propionibacteriaceae bacterium]
MPDISPLNHRDTEHPISIFNIAKAIWRTIDACFTFRIMGLAAETAFYLLLSLPPLLFGLSGAIGFIASSFPATTVTWFRSELLSFAGRFMTSDVISEVLAPTLDDVLTNGRVDVVSIGFLLALWSGSRAVSAFVDTATIMYGMRGQRHWIRSRALAFLIYIVLILGGAILFPLVLTGPTLIAKILPNQIRALTYLYWPVVIVGGLAILTTMFHVTLPIHRRWRCEIPGAIITIAMWVIGSWWLRSFIAHNLGSASLYGPLATPIALMMWLYLISVAALIGAALNNAVNGVWPNFSAANTRS